MSTYNPNNGKNMPWFETDDVSKINAISLKYKEAAESYISKGYCILETDTEDNLIDEVNQGIFNHLKKDNPKLNPDYYHYNSSPRIIEGWKHIPSIVALANNKNAILGANIFYDYEFDEGHSRASLGIEYLASNFQFIMSGTYMST